MPGILGVVKASGWFEDTRTVLEKMAEPIRYDDSQQVDYFQLDRCAAAVVDYGKEFTFLRPAYAQRENVLLIMDGEVFPDASEVPPDLVKPHPTIQRAEYCLHLYLLYGSNFISRLNGTFLIAIYDARDSLLHLYTDRFPSRIMTYWQKDSEVTFASSPRSILRYRDDIGRNYDLLALTELLAFERVRGEKTLFADIRRLPPACHAQWDGTRWYREDYAPSRFRPSPQPWHSWKDAAIEFSMRLNQAVSKRNGDGAKTAALISGGIDSRLLLGFSQPGVVAASFTNKGAPPSKEVQLAAQIAAVCGVPFLALEREEDYYAKIAKAAAETMEGLWTIAGCHALGTQEQMAKAEIQAILTGNYFDTLFKGFFGEPLVPESHYPDEPRLLKARRRAHQLVDTLLIRKRDHQDLLTLAFRDEIKDVLAVAREHAIRDLTCSFLMDAPWLDLVDRATPQDLQSSGATIGTMREITRRFLNRSPIYDNHLFELAWQIPYAWKSRGRLVRYALCTHFPRLALIRDNNTGLPAGLFPPYDLFPLEFLRQIRRAARWLSRYSRFMASLRQPPPGMRIYQTSAFHDLNGLLKSSLDYQILIKNAIERLDRNIFDVDCLLGLLRDDLAAHAPRLNPLFQGILTFSLFDQAWGPGAR